MRVILSSEVLQKTFSYGAKSLKTLCFNYVLKAELIGFNW